jgi:hypothetical protein
VPILDISEKGKAQVVVLPEGKLIKTKGTQIRMENCIRFDP